MEDISNNVISSSSDSLTNLIITPRPILHSTTVSKTPVQKDKKVVDYIPPKYERETKSDLIVKYLTFMIIGIDILIFFGTIKKLYIIFIIYFIYFILFALLFFFY
jgi:hypothetical protein